MRFDNAYIPLPLLWSSPFIRWQSAAADYSSIDMAIQVTRDALEAAKFDPSEVSQIVYGGTIPQQRSFYVAPYVAANLGMTEVGGPAISQACATAVSCIAAGAAASVLGGGTQLVITSDRTSNGPLMVYPRSVSMGGSPIAEHWVLESFAADPWTGESMLYTADGTAADGGFSREQCDELTLMRYAQYQHALRNDREAQRRYMRPIVIAGRKSSVTLDSDEGVSDYTPDSLARLKPVAPGGAITPGTQTHPADGSAGAVITDKDTARRMSKGQPIVRILAAGFARAEKGRMPKAPAIAAARALKAAGVPMSEVKTVTTHNPFAVNDLWFSQATGFPLEKMNLLGCSLIYGHPQAPTGMRAIAELAHVLAAEGGGIGMFSGCAAGDMGASVVVSVE